MVRTHFVSASRALFVLLIMRCMGGPAVTEAQGDEFNYDEAKVPRYTLPDPLVTLEGQRVTDADTWWMKRRPELLSLFKEHVYGAMPPARKIARVETHEVELQGLGGKVIRKQLTLYFSKDGSGLGIHVLIFAPKRTREMESFPAFIGYNFEGNHTVHEDKKIHMSKIWDRGADAPRVPDESTRGSRAAQWQIEKVVARGYAIATVYYGDVDPDFYDQFQNGIHTFYPEYQNRGDNWTSIGAWAWGLSRVLDYLETDDLIDANRVAVIGHSRLGKTSLWTGATDQRFAMVISNNSGCGGAALARRRFGETVAQINSNFPHWFCANHKNYNNNEDAMPVDHHQLIALIAPRPVYVASAQEDRWADPHGEFLSCVGADDVYRLLGTEGLPVQKWPAVNHPVQGRIAYHVRSGKHDVTEYDWQQYLGFADKHMR